MAVKEKRDSDGNGKIWGYEQPEDDIMEMGNKGKGNSEGKRNVLENERNEQINLTYQVGSLKKCIILERKSNK